MRAIDCAGLMIDVDDIVQAIFLGVPEAALEFGAAGFEHGGPTLIDLAGDPKGVEPEGLDFDRLADARSDNPIVGFGIHPSELNAGDAGGEQAVGILMDAEARAAGVAIDNGEHGFLQRAAVFGADGFAAVSGGAQQIVNGDDEPEGGVDGIEFGMVAFIEKAIGEHAFADGGSPGEENIEGDIETIDRQA